MDVWPANLEQHRVAATDIDAVCNGRVRYAPLKSIWFLGMRKRSAIETWGAPDRRPLGPKKGRIT